MQHQRSLRFKRVSVDGNRRGYVLSAGGDGISQIPYERFTPGLVSKVLAARPIVWTLGGGSDDFISRFTENRTNQFALLS